MSDYKKSIQRAKEAILWAKHFRESGNSASAAWNLTQAAFWRGEAKWYSLSI